MNNFFENKLLVEDLDFKNEIILKISKWNIDEFINLLVYGGVSSGKTTQIYALLATIMNDKRVYDLKNAVFEEDRKSICYKTSMYHIEIDPIQLGSNDKFFIQNFLKSYAETRNIGLDIPKIIYIKNADLLSKNAQFQLRKIIEKTCLTARFIFEVNALSNFLPPLISRCLVVRISYPKKENIIISIKKFCEKKEYEIDDVIINEIIEENIKINYIPNLKKIYGYLKYYLITKKKFHLLYYDQYYEILNYITNKKISFASLQKIRDIINELYINLISMEELMFFIFYELNKKYNDEKFLLKLLDLTILCNIRLKKGNKDCLHIEYYIISIIDIINNE